MELKTLSDVSTEIIKAIYESMRVSSFIQYKGNPHIKNNNRVRSPEDLIPFNWDNENKKTETPENMLYKMRLIAKEINTNAKPR